MEYQPVSWNPFSVFSFLFRTRNVAKRQGRVALWLFAVVYATLLTAEWISLPQQFFAPTEGLLLDPTALFGFSVANGIFIMVLCQWYTDHHWAVNAPRILGHSPVLFRESYYAQRVFVVSFALFARFACSPLAGYFIQWLSLTYHCGFTLERPVGLKEKPPGELAPQSLIQEMALANSAFCNCPNSTSNQLVTFIKEDNGVKAPIGTGFVLRADKSRWIVTAEHVWRRANMISRWGSTKAYNLYELESSGKIKPYVNTSNDYVMLEMVPELHSAFGGGLEHIVPKVKYEEIYVPHAYSDRVVLSKGNSYTRLKVSGGSLRHTASTIEGCSGAPLLVKLHNDYRVFGLHLGADPRLNENYGCYFGLVSLAEDSFRAERFSKAFTTQESAQPNSQRGNKRYYSDEEENWEELYDEYDQVFGDENNDYYSDGRSDVFIVRRRRGKKHGFSRLYEESGPLDLAQRPLSFPSVPVKTTVTPTPVQTKLPPHPANSKLVSAKSEVGPTQPLKDQAESANTISSQTSGNTPKVPASTSPQEKPSTGTPSPKLVKQAGKPLATPKAPAGQSKATFSKSLKKQLGQMSLEQLQELTKQLPKGHVLRKHLLPSKTQGGTGGH